MGQTISGQVRSRAIHSLTNQAVSMTNSTTTDRIVREALS